MASSASSGGGGGSSSSSKEPLAQTQAQTQAQAQAQAQAQQLASHGRGGAGNMADARQSPKTTPSDLETPVLKTAVVTTGRGGTGNMARNEDPAETRLLQDVRGVPRRDSSGAQHAGRGGAGNVVRDLNDEPAGLARETSRDQAVVDDGRPAESLAAKGKKGWLFGKKA